MRSNEIKIGREYVVKYGYGEVRGTVMDKRRDADQRLVVVVHTTSVGRVTVFPRSVLREVELMQERKMDLLVAFADGLEPTSSFRSVPPTVVAYAEDGLPLTAEVAPRSGCSGLFSEDR